MLELACAKKNVYVATWSRGTFLVMSGCGASGKAALALGRASAAKKLKGVRLGLGTLGSLAFADPCCIDIRPLSKPKLLASCRNSFTTS